MSTEAFLTLATVVLSGGFITALIAVFKARPERDSVIVSTAQNASAILQGLNDALYEELERERQARKRAEEQIRAAEQRADEAYKRADAAETRAANAERRATDAAQRASSIEDEAKLLAARVSELEVVARGKGTEDES